MATLSGVIQDLSVVFTHISLIVQDVGHLFIGYLYFWEVYIHSGSFGFFLWEGDRFFCLILFGLIVVFSYVLDYSPV